MPAFTPQHLAAFALSAAVLAAGALPALASAAACKPQPTSKAFAKYGDTADYSLAPGGNFESGKGGWTLLTGARIVSGNNTANLSGTGSKSLQLTPGSIAISPEFCVSDANPYFRYMLKSNFFAANVNTIVQYKDANGSATAASLWIPALSWVQPNIFPGKWTAGVKNPLSLRIPLRADGSATARVMFVSTSGFYNIDDVMIDPYRRG